MQSLRHLKSQRGNLWYWKPRFEPLESSFNVCHGEAQCKLGLERLVVSFAVRHHVFDNVYR
jgi:hypothetical protein